MPNPFNESFRIRLNSDSDQDIRISIVTQPGKVVYEETKRAIPGENIFTITPADLKKGYYTLRIIGKSFFKALGIIKL
jgi:hypothetical protein